MLMWSDRDFEGQCYNHNFWSSLPPSLFKEEVEVQTVSAIFGQGCSCLDLTSGWRRERRPEVLFSFIDIEGDSWLWHALLCVLGQVSSTLCVTYLLLHRRTSPQCLFCLIIDRHLSSPFPWLRNSGSTWLGGSGSDFSKGCLMLARATGRLHWGWGFTPQVTLSHGWQVSFSCWRDASGFSPVGFFTGHNSLSMSSGHSDWFSPEWANKRLRQRWYSLSEFPKSHAVTSAVSSWWHRSALIQCEREPHKAMSVTRKASLGSSGDLLACSVGCFLMAHRRWHLVIPCVTKSLCTQGISTLSALCLPIVSKENWTNGIAESQRHCSENMGKKSLSDERMAPWRKWLLNRALGPGRIWLVRRSWIGSKGGKKSFYSEGLT